jgi:hypothetical protein
MAVPGSVFDRVCAACGRQVMIAPSGQKILREQPCAVIRCGPCFEKKEDPEMTIEFASGTFEEMDRERKSARPNLRRNRN